MRAVFHEEQEAEEVRAALAVQGFEATVARDRFAGEDDDEDHAWAVRTDAPEVVLELLAERYDGWVDAEDERPGGPRAAASGVRLDLPEGPRRVKGHFRG